MRVQEQVAGESKCIRCPLEVELQVAVNDLSSVLGNEA